MRVMRGVYNWPAFVAAIFAAYINSSTAQVGVCCTTTGTCRTVSTVQLCNAQELSIASAVCGPNPCPVPNPSYNQCVSARVLTSGAVGSYVGTTIGSTSDLGSSICVGSEDDTLDVWFRFTNTRATSTTFTFSTDGTPDINGNGGDTTLSLFSACPPGGAALACDDNGGQLLNSRITYTMAPAQVVLIRVAFNTNCPPSAPCVNAGTATGLFRLNITDLPLLPPSNDACAHAQPIPSSPGTVLGNSDLSTGADITPCGNTDELDVWFTFTPLVSGQYTFDTLGSIGNDDTTLAIFQGCPDELTAIVQPLWPATLLACNDDIVALNGSDDDNYLSFLRANLAAGVAYKLRVSGFGNLTGEFRLNAAGPMAALEAVPDTCQTALTVTGALSKSLYSGGARPDAPPGSCNTVQALADDAADNAVWFTFIPATSGTLTGQISAEMGMVRSDSLLMLLSGACGSLTQLACLNPTIPPVATFDLAQLPMVVAGTPYYLVIADVGRFDGGADLDISINVPGGVLAGACCFGSTCSLTTAPACTGPNTIFIGPGTSCNIFGLNNTTPCCLADFNKNPGAPLSVQDLFDFLAAYFSGSLAANINGSNVPPVLSVQDLFDFLAAYFAGC